MRKLALLGLLAICACSSHHSHGRYDHGDGRHDRQAMDAHHNQQRHGDWDDDAWNWKRNKND